MNLALTDFALPVLHDPVRPYDSLSILHDQLYLSAWSWLYLFRIILALPLLHNPGSWFWLYLWSIIILAVLILHDPVVPICMIMVMPVLRDPGCTFALGRFVTWYWPYLMRLFCMILFVPVLHDPGLGPHDTRTSHLQGLSRHSSVQRSFFDNGFCIFPPLQ